MEKNWQIKLFQKSLKKKQRVTRVSNHLKKCNLHTTLELGCARGIVGFHLRRMGGNWISADTDMINLKAAHVLLGNTLVCIDPLQLPLKNETFSCITALDIIEHIDDDHRLLTELYRILKPQGNIIVTTPSSGTIFLANRLKMLLGLTPGTYGHVREGYSAKALTTKMREIGFNILYWSTFTGFFTEMVEMLINFVYIKKMGKKKAHKRDGAISPSNEKEFEKNKKLFRFYSIVFPVIWLFSRLDSFLFFLKGYTLLIVAKK